MKRFLMVLIFLLVMPLAFARQSAIINNNQIKIDFIGNSPSPITIGSEAVIFFEAFNTGSNVVKDFEITAVDKFPFEIIGSNIMNILELQLGDSYKFDFKVKISPNINEGSYQFGFQYFDPANDRVEPIIFNISIKRISRAIASTKAITDPEYIPPGGIGLINIEIENNADFAMKDVEVKLNFSDSVPVSPYQTSSQKQIKRIESKSSEMVTFQVIALPDAEPNVYRLPLSLIFDDELGNENTRQEEIGIIISKTPEYDLTVEDSSLIKGNTNKIILSLSNIGPSNIKYLILEVLPSKYYTILNPPRIYIGNLEPDDYETSEFDFYPKKSGFIPVKVKLEYKDDMNNPIKETKEVQIYVYSRTKAKMMGLIPSNTIRNIILLLIIIFVYLTYKTWRSTRNLTNSMKQSGLKMLMFSVNLVRHIRWRYIKRIPRKIRIFFIKLQ